MKNFGNISDKEIVRGIVLNDPDVIEYFFFEKCSNMFIYIINSVFSGRVDRDELLNELFLYLASDNWKKIRDFSFESSLLTWTTVVAVRFFIKKREILIEKQSTETLIIEESQRLYEYSSVDVCISLEMAISQLTNARYREVIIRLDVNEESYESVAKDLNVSVANLYNIHRRAITQLKLILKE